MLSNRMRFDVLVRDGFKCRYCGAGPQQSALTVDHVVPLSSGGRNEPSNLVTACYDCNIGKSDTAVDSVPDSAGVEFEFDAPRDAPITVLSAISSPEMALQVAIEARGIPHFAVAAYCGISPGYLSLLRSGKRPIPDKLVGALCAATGSNLIRQYFDLSHDPEGLCEVSRLAQLLRAA